MDHEDKAPEALPKQPGLEVWKPVSHSRHSGHIRTIWPWSNQKHAHYDLSPQQASHHRFTFGSGLLIGVLSAMIVVGTALGGGLGTALATCQRSANANAPTMSGATTTASTTAPSSTGIVPFDNYVPASHNEVETLKNDCEPNKNVINSFGDTFSSSCNLDYSHSHPAAEGGVIADIMTMISYSWQDCLDACSGLNNRSSLWALPTRCRSITFRTSMRDTTALMLGNCWLKNATLADSGQAVASKYAMSAKLISPLP